ncbi:MAG: PD40 domain-containing protein [Candidatus Doudnabacteria bacterium]|nr:PD40 domain-containing protein [Candidatus Doudnabacteria bacterium]
MNKRAIAILGAIFLLIVGTLAFLIFQRRASNQQAAGTDDTTPTPTPTYGLPLPSVTPTSEVVPTEVATGLKPVSLATGGVISPVLFYQGNGIAYFNSQGQLFQADLDSSNAEPRLTNLRELGIPGKTGVAKVYWPAAGNNFLVELTTADGSTAWAVYVSSKGAYVDVPKQVTSIMWMPDGEQLLYLWLENGKTNLNISPADLSTWQTITDMWENDDAISIAPDGRTILFWRTKSGEATNTINMVSPDGKLFRTVVKDGYNVGALWSPDSQKFAFNRRSESGILQLWVGNVYTGEVQNINVDARLDQVVWSPDSKIIYAASGNTGGDLLYKIDIVGQTQKVVEVASRISPAELFMSADGKGLFFRNNLDGGLYYLNVGLLGN